MSHEALKGRDMVRCSPRAFVGRRLRVFVAPLQGLPEVSTAIPCPRPLAWAVEFRPLGAEVRQAIDLVSAPRVGSDQVSRASTNTQAGADLGSWRSAFLVCRRPCARSVNSQPSRVAGGSFREFADLTRRRSAPAGVLNRHKVILLNPEHACLRPSKRQCVQNEGYCISQPFFCC
jgi:hypothetical protein